MSSELTLKIDASDKEIRDFFKEHYSQTDADVTDEQIANAASAHQANAAWRSSLPIQDQLALNNVPVTHAPNSLDPENPPVGVTIVSAGDSAPTGNVPGSTGTSDPAGTGDPANAGGSTPGNPGQ